MATSPSPPLPRFCYRWNGELQLAGVPDGAPVPPSVAPSSRAGVTLHSGLRVQTDVRVKRVPLHLVDARSIDFNIALSAEVENEERLYSGGVHLLRTLTCVTPWRIVDLARRSASPNYPISRHNPPSLSLHCILPL
jgi:hypothetical protein